MNRFAWVLVLLLPFHPMLHPARSQAQTPPRKTPELLKQGKAVFEKNCALCHGLKGDGKGQLGATFKPPPNDFTKPLSEWPTTKGDMKKVFDAITKGVPNTSMVKWGHLSEKDRWALVHTVLEFSKPPAKK